MNIKMRVCPHCGEVFNFGELVCGNCGKSTVEMSILQEQWNRMTEEEQQRQISKYTSNPPNRDKGGQVETKAVEYIYCRQCGRKVSASADICPNCGSKQNYKSNPSGSGKSSFSLTRIIALVLLIVIVAAFFNIAINRGSNSLVGTWTPQKSNSAPWGYPDVLKLKSGGKGTCDGFSIYNWTTRGNKLIIETSYEYLEYEYKLSFGKLTLDGVPYKKS